MLPGSLLQHIWTLAIKAAFPLSPSLTAPVISSLLLWSLFLFCCWGGCCCCCSKQSEDSPEEGWRAVGRRHHPGKSSPSWRWHGSAWTRAWKLVDVGPGGMQQVGTWQGRGLCLQTLAFGLESQQKAWDAGDPVKDLLAKCGDGGHRAPREEDFFFQHMWPLLQPSTGHMATYFSTCFRINFSWPSSTVTFWKLYSLEVLSPKTRLRGLSNSGIFSFLMWECLI